MNEKNIYVVDVARSDTAAISVKIAAASISAAKAYVARTMITARMAKPSELLGVDPSTVVDAATGVPLSHPVGVHPDQQPLPIPPLGSIEDVASRLAAGESIDATT